MLKFKGHLFFGDSHCACCVADARMISVDPTGTADLRKAFNSTLAIRWRGLRVSVRRMIVDQDILARTSRSMFTPSNPVIQGGATRTQMFQRWFDYMAGAQVLASDGSFMRPFIEKGYAAGRKFAQDQVGLYSVPLAGDRQETIFQLAVVELQGIIEAASQQAVRAVAYGLLHGQRASTIARAVQSAIDRVGIPRSTALVELLTIKAFSEASLDVYQSAGVKRVGLVPETLIVSTRDARKVTPSGRFGTRSRRGEAPGLRTIQRIKKQEREVEGALVGGLVSVVTAGDKRVCKVCRLIAKRGPYKINKARMLIPAHPRCRCVFVPVVTRSRAATDERPRGPAGKWAELARSRVGSDPGVEAAIAKLDLFEEDEISVKELGFNRTATPVATRPGEKFAERNVPLEEIVLYQPTVSRIRLFAYITNPTGEPAEVIWSRGKYFAIGGTYRLVAAKLRGSVTVNARVYARK